MDSQGKKGEFRKKEIAKTTNAWKVAASTGNDLLPWHLFVVPSFAIPNAFTPPLPRHSTHSIFAEGFVLLFLFFFQLNCSGRLRQTFSAIETQKWVKKMD
jgi:hypothetical protein